jgi:hypothetical protein
MTSVKVNLLPPEIAERGRERRRVALTAAGLAAFVAALGVVYVNQLGDVDEARTERDAQQARVAALQAEEDSLAEYRTLADRFESRNGVLATAMADEVAVARILNDFALSFPASASLRSLSLAIDLAPADAAAADGQTPVAPAPAPGDRSEETIGTLSFEGYSVQRYEPGVAAIVTDFADVPTFRQPYVSAAQEETIADTEVTGFAGSAEITGTAYTDRYADGLPEQEAS